MASYQISAIEAFDFSTPTEWPNWICCFEQFRNTSGIADKSEESQIMLWLKHHVYKTL